MESTDELIHGDEIEGVFERLAQTFTELTDENSGTRNLGICPDCLYIASAHAAHIMIAAVLSQDDDSLKNPGNMLSAIYAQGIEVGIVLGRQHPLP